MAFFLMNLTKPNYNNRNTLFGKIKHCGKVIPIKPKKTNFFMHLLQIIVSILFILTNIQILWIKF